MKANDHISFLSQLANEKLIIFGNNLYDDKNLKTLPVQDRQDRQDRQDSDILHQNFDVSPSEKEKYNSTTHVNKPSFLDSIEVNEEGSKNEDSLKNIGNVNTRQDLKESNLGHIKTLQSEKKPEDFSGIITEIRDENSDDKKFENSLIELRPSSIGLLRKSFDPKDPKISTYLTEELIHIINQMRDLLKNLKEEREKNESINKKNEELEVFVSKVYSLFFLK